jgi:N-acetylglutamate synthase-like GNAT family acetyltransferase
VPPEARPLVPLRGEDLDALRLSLEEAGLPSDDVGEAGQFFYRLDLEGGASAFAGLQTFGEDALLRSVVLPGEARGRQQGRLLVAAMISEAERLGIARLWLLTTTAAGFFSKLGFDRATRDAAPKALRASREFASLCPASATCMMLHLPARSGAEPHPGAAGDGRQAGSFIPWSERPRFPPR